MTAEKKVIDRNPWPADPITAYRSIEEHTWGYMTIYDDLTFDFNTDVTPSVEEIKARWEHRFESRTQHKQERAE